MAKTRKRSVPSTKSLIDGAADAMLLALRSGPGSDELTAASVTFLVEAERRIGRQRACTMLCARLHERLGAAIENANLVNLPSPTDVERALDRLFTTAAVTH